MKANTANVWGCIDCTLTHANGECGENPDREPLGLIKPGEELTMGLPAGEHADSCTEVDREEGCDCERQEFSNSDCDLCGSALAGERHAFTVWFDQ